jgi:hypothetical protein
LLHETLRFLHDRRDTLFQSLADLQAKSVWLAIFGLGLIVVAACTFHREPLLLFGALGGFISRTVQLLRRVPRGTDYGASSSPFILAPVIGALSGWAGVAIVQGLVSVNVLNKEFFGHVWDDPLRVLPLAIAFAFGFTERLLNRMVSSTVQLLSSQTKKPAEPAPG